MKIKSTLFVIMILLFSSNSYCQNLKHIESYFLLLSYSDQAKEVEHLLPSIKDIITIISFNIPNIKKR